MISRGLRPNLPSDQKACDSVMPFRQQQVPMRPSSRRPSRFRLASALNDIAHTRESWNSPQQTDSTHETRPIPGSNFRHPTVVQSSDTSQDEFISDWESQLSFDSRAQGHHRFAPHNLQESSRSISDGELSSTRETSEDESFQQYDLESNSESILPSKRLRGDRNISGSLQNTPGDTWKCLRSKIREGYNSVHVASNQIAAVMPRLSNVLIVLLMLGVFYTLSVHSLSPSDGRVRDLVRKSLSELLLANETESDAWTGHVVVEPGVIPRIDIPGTFQSRLNKELAPLMEIHKSQIWGGDSLHCRAPETEFVAFSLDRSSRIPAFVSIQCQTRSGCPFQKSIEDLHELTVSLPEKTSPYMFHFDVAEEKGSGFSGHDTPRRYVSWGKFSGSLGVELSDTGKIALQRFCGESAHDLDSDPMDRTNTRLVTVLELKRLYHFWQLGSQRISPNGVYLPVFQLHLTRDNINPSNLILSRWQHRLRSQLDQSLFTENTAKTNSGDSVDGTSLHTNGANDLDREANMKSGRGPSTSRYVPTHQSIRIEASIPDTDDIEAVERRQTLNRRTSFEEKDPEDEGQEHTEDAESEDEESRPFRGKENYQRNVVYDQASLDNPSSSRKGYYPAQVAPMSHFAKPNQLHSPQMSYRRAGNQQMQEEPTFTGWSSNGNSGQIRAARHFEPSSGDSKPVEQGRMYFESSRERPHLQQTPR